MRPTSPSAEPAPETAAMIDAVWPDDLAPLVARLIRTRPSLGARLALAPRRAVHAAAVYLYGNLAENGVASGADAEALAREVDERDPRDLLSEALPGCDARLYRLLDRLGPTVRGARFYSRLDALLRGPAAPLVLASPYLGGEDALDAIDLVRADPVLLAAGQALGCSPYTAQCAASALAYLRTAGLARDIEALPPGAGLAALVRRLRSDLARAHPPAPATFPAPPGWAHVETVGDLWMIGRKLGNCVASIRSGSAHHVRAFLDGTEIMLVHEGEPTLLACVEQAGPDLWHLAQCSGARNAPAPARLREGLRDGLRAAGVRLVEVDCACAIEHLVFSTEARGRAGAALIEAEDDEAEDEAA